MPCYKTLALVSAADEFTPLHTAVYVAASDTIVGTMGNFLAEFNSTTGAFIRAVNVSSPMYGPMNICLLGSDPYLACHNDRSVQNVGGTVHVHVRDDIFSVNTSTLQLGSGLGIPTLHIDADYESEGGPRQFVQIGNKVYFLFPIDNKVLIVYVDKTAPGVWGGSHPANNAFWTEQIATDGTSVYTCDPYLEQIDYHTATLGAGGHSHVTGYHPTSCIWVPAPVGKIHAVCADKYLIRVDVFATSTNSYFDLETLISSVVTGIKPMRLRYNSVDGLIYIPVQNKDGIIVYDPVAETAVWKSGFDSPVDAVFTPSKKFAVQSSLEGLKEIT